MKKEWMQALVLWGIALLILLTVVPVAKAENLYDSVIRLHVLANSDDARDQELKLLVRDGILDYAKDVFSSISTREEAEEILPRHFGAMKAVAEDILSEAGNPMPVSVSLRSEEYPTREYDSLALPSGEYLSLQVKIGDAEGKNWWCVLFPPLCLNSAMGAEDALLNAGMEEENVKTVTRNGTEYVMRFKILELFQEAKTKIKSFF